MLTVRQQSELAAGPRRAALAFPAVPVADAIARRWGEGVWTHPAEFSFATLMQTPGTGLCAVPWPHGPHEWAALGTTVVCCGRAV